MPETEKKQSLQQAGKEMMQARRAAAAEAAKAAAAEEAAAETAAPSTDLVPVLKTRDAQLAGRKEIKGTEGEFDKVRGLVKQRIPGYSDSTMPMYLNINPQGAAYRLCARLGNRMVLAWEHRQGAAKRPWIYLANLNGVLECATIKGNNGVMYASENLLAEHYRANGWWWDQVDRDAEHWGLEGKDLGTAHRLAVEGLEKLTDGDFVRGKLVSQIAVLPDMFEAVGFGQIIQVVSINDIDSNPRYLGAPNGVVDLATGRLLPPEEGAKTFTTCVLPDPFKRKSEHPDVSRLFEHCTDVQGEWLLDALAYCLWGRPARRLLYLFGPKAGGKSTLVNALEASLGDACKKVSPAAFAPTRRSQTGPSPEMAALMPPTRLATAPEIEGSEVDPAKLKMFSGSDSKLPWRGLYQAERRDTPTATPMLVGNGLPRGGLGAGEDAALADRLVVVEYPTIPDTARDGYLVTAWDDTAKGAKKRRQALIAMLVRKASKHAPGQPPPIPAEIREATEALVESDKTPARQWIDEHIVKTPDGRLLASDAWRAACMYETGLDEIGDSIKTAYGLSKQRFINLISDSTSNRIKTTIRDSSNKQRRGRGWVGLELGYGARHELMTADLKAKDHG